MENSKKKKFKEEEEDTKETFFRGIRLRGSGELCKGKKQHLEDRYVVLDSKILVIVLDYLSIANERHKEVLGHENMSFYGIFDGHGIHFLSISIGGEKAATEAALQFPHVLLDSFLEIAQEMKKDVVNLDGDNGTVVRKALVRAFLSFDKALLLDSSVESDTSGSTASILLIVNEMVWCANIGDSICVLGRIRKKDNRIWSIKLTHQHTALLKEEQTRITEFGGTVKNGRVGGKLEVSRSFGDPVFKKQGVIAVPHISRFRLDSKRDKFFVLGVDGLWSVFTPQDAVEFVWKTRNHYTNPDIPQQAKALISEAVLERQAVDNVSCIVVGVF